MDTQNVLSAYVGFLAGMKTMCSVEEAVEPLISISI